MMQTRLLTGAAFAALLTACTTTLEEDAMPVVTAMPQATGVFAQDSTLPFKTVDFAAIQDSDYAPAFEQAMAIQRAEIAAITANPDAPTFQNTIVALERTGRMLERVSIAFSTETGANTNDVLDAVDAEMSPKLSAHYDAINLDPALFARVNGCGGQVEVTAEPDTVSDGTRVRRTTFGGCRPGWGG